MLQRSFGTTRRVGLASSVAGLVVAAAFLVAAHGDESLLVHAAPPQTDAAAAPDALTVRSPDDGFDGQYYFRLANRPLSDDDVVSGVRLDLPSLRSQRVGYPVVARVLALGQTGWIPWSLILVNVLAMGCIGWLGALLAEHLGRAPAWGFAFALYPGFVYTLGFDLAELVEVALVLGGLLLVLRRRPVAAGLVLAAAVLTKEPACLLPFGLGVSWAWESWQARRERRPDLLAALPAAIPAVAFGAWQLVLRSTFHELPLASNGDKNASFPFAGLLDVADRFTPTSGQNLFRDLSLAFLVGVAVLALLSWRRTTAPAGVRVGWLASVALMVVLSGFVYAGATSFMRAGSEGYVLGVLMVLGSDLTVISLLAPSVGLVSLLTFGSEVAKAR